MSRTFAVIELAFTAVFAVEVVVALLAYQFPAFFHSAWNIFDSVIVLVSVISYIEDDVPAFNPLRIIRVFRAVKVMYVCMCVCVYVCSYVWTHACVLSYVFRIIRVFRAVKVIRPRSPCSKFRFTGFSSDSQGLASEGCVPLSR